MDVILHPLEGTIYSTDEFFLPSFPTGPSDDTNSSYLAARHILVAADRSRDDCARTPEHGCPLGAILAGSAEAS